MTNKKLFDVCYDSIEDIAYRRLAMYLYFKHLIISNDLETLKDIYKDNKYLLDCISVFNCCIYTYDIYIAIFGDNFNRTINDFVLISRENLSELPLEEKKDSWEKINELIRFNNCFNNTKKTKFYYEDFLWMERVARFNPTESRSHVFLSNNKSELSKADFLYLVSQLTENKEVINLCNDEINKLNIEKELNNYGLDTKVKPILRKRINTYCKL